MPKKYVDNAMNRSLGRVGMPHGSAVHSRSSNSGFGSSYSSSGGSSSSSSWGSPRTYVDNSMNRQLGRVGMEHGTAVHSRSNTSSAYLECAISLGSRSVDHRSSSGSVYGSSISSSGTARTYVDNPMNRRLDRVGLEHGTAVHSRSNEDHAVSRSSGPTFGFSAPERKSSSESGYSSKGTYVDNAMNRQLGRVGMEHGTAVHSRSSENNSASRSSGSIFGFASPGSSYGSDSRNSSSSSASKTYVDNAMNRSLGRVGMEHGTAVHSKSKEDCDVSRSSERSGASSASNKSSQGSQAEKSGVKKYVDNVLNRKLGRVGKIHGTAIKPRYSDNEASKNKGDNGTSAMSKTTPAQKVYVDNAFNRKHNRVGLPLGSVPISKHTKVNRDTYKRTTTDRSGENRETCTPTRTTTDRCGENRETRIVIENKLAVLYRHLEENFADEIPEELYDLPEETVTCVLDFKQRGQEIEKYLEETIDANWQPHEHTSREIIKKYQGTIIDFEKLQMGQRIGQGGFGEVYLATLDGQAVAVKKLKFQQVTKKRLQLFQNEMDVFISLDHPNVASFLGACVVAPNLAIVMELMDMSLYDAIHIKEVSFTATDKLDIMRGVTEGMAYLHNQDIAHCDLKTQNVLLINIPGEAMTSDTDPVLAKITDFGLSRMKSDVTTSTSIPSARFWTPRYAAPEKHQGNILNLDQQKMADMFSLGLLLWELAMEEIPFEDLDPEQLKLHVGKKGLTPAAQGNVRLDERLQKYISLCWSMEPDRRPTANNMAEIGRVLTNILEPGEE